MTMTYTFLDLETTGLDRFHDQVIEFYAVSEDKDGNVLDSISESCRTEKWTIPNPESLLINNYPPV